MFAVRNVWKSVRTPVKLPIQQSIKNNASALQPFDALFTKWAKWKVKASNIRT